MFLETYLELPAAVNPQDTRPVLLQMIHDSLNVVLCDLVLQSAEVRSTAVALVSNAGQVADCRRLQQ